METKIKTAQDISRQSIEDNVTVDVQQRLHAPLNANFYFGPTNSGKTYHALQALYAEYIADPTGVYVYAGPLRMLAYEVYLKMVEQFGVEEVGFITGDETINPGARMLATTAEMAPMSGAAIILDEAHWITEEDRGDHWTRLLRNAEYVSFHVVSAKEASPRLKELLSDAYHISENTYSRRTDISFEGSIGFHEIPAKTAVVCFSRDAVLDVAKKLIAKGYKTGVLYGALPLNVRKHYIDLFINNEIDIIVTTDVIGHGINLPIDNVVFAETSKYDGHKQRRLMRWETAQIAGRAGRFGLSDKGCVYILEGHPKFKPSEKIVEEGVLCAAGKLDADMVTDKAIIGLAYKDLNLTEKDTPYLMHALKTWQDKASDAFPGENIKPSSLKDRLALLEKVSMEMGYYLNPWNKFGDTVIINGREMVDVRTLSHKWLIPLNDLWALISGPYDPTNEVVGVIASWLASSDRNKSPIVRDFMKQVASDMKKVKLDDVEDCLHKISEVRMSFMMFGNEGKLGYLHLKKVESLYSECEALVLKLLDKEINKL